MTTTRKLGTDLEVSPVGPWIVPIPGTRRLERIEENLGAARVELSGEDLAELDAVSAANQVEGDRYRGQMQKLVDR